MFDADAGAPDPLVYRDRAIQGGGNIAKGQTLFRDERGLGCAKCHRVAGEGGAVGPDLSGIGAQYDRAYLAESVLFPSKIVRDDFRLTTIVTQTGELRVGVVRGETAESIVLLDAEGARHEIPKAEVQSRETGALSLMPEGLIDGLSPQEFADLVSYLETLRAAPPRPGE
jgi:putative heme-binding domain-containing protein